MKWIYLKTVSFEIGAWLTGGFIFLLWSMRSKHWTVDHKNETVTVDFWGSQLLMFFTEVTEQTVATTEWYKSQRKTLTGLQNKTKHPTTENKRITEIVGSLEIILLWSVMNMVCYEHGLLWVVCYEWSVMSGLLWTGLFWMGTILKHCYVFMSHNFQTVYCNWVQRKILILKVVVAIAYVATILTSKIKR